MEEVDKLLRDFEAVMGESLLFLNNVRKVGVYTAKEDGTIELEYETRLTADESNTQKQREFFEHVQHEAKRLKSEDGAPRLGDFAPKEVVVQCCLSASDGDSEEWLVVNRFGLSQQEKIALELQCPDAVRKHSFLPLGGVALCLSPGSSDQKKLSATSTHSDKISDRKSSQDHFGRGESNVKGQYHINSKDELRAQGEKDETTGKDTQKTSPTFKDSGEKQESDDFPDKRNEREFHAYCMLPLPVKTGLPVHVNARFALDHETRRNIDTRSDNELVTWNQLLADRVIVPAYISALQEVKRLCFSRERNSLSHGDTREGDDRSQSWNKGRQQSRVRNWERNQKDKRSRQKDLNLITSTDVDMKLKLYSNFFPDHKDGVDTYWKSLVTSFYTQLAQAEEDVFPAVREDLDRLVWVPAVKSAGFSGYFCKDSELNIPKDVLMRLNMNIIQCSYRIYQNFVESKVGMVKHVTVGSVIDFLRSCNRDGFETDTCNLKNLPRPVHETALGSVENVTELFKFLNKGSELKDLKGLPLSLRMSGDLHYFIPEDITIVSGFCSLLTGSLDLFLDSKLLDYADFANCHHPDKCPSFLKGLGIQTFVELLPDTLDHSTLGIGLTKVLLETMANQKQLPNQLWIKRFWQFLENELKDKVEEEDITAVLNFLRDWSLIPVAEETQIRLLPFKNRNIVVHIPKTEDKQPENVRHAYQVCEINRILQKLPLNKIAVDLLPSTSVATKVVASVSIPQRLLYALAASNMKISNLSPTEAVSMLDFFFTSVDCSQFIERICSLPFFEGPDGCLTAVGGRKPPLCLHAAVPRDGLKQWSNKQNIPLVKVNGRLQDLFDLLHFRTPKDETDFYTSHLLPSIADLPERDIFCHMSYIRDNLLMRCDKTDLLLQTLRETPFIPVDGVLYRASSFFSPCCKVFEVMLSQGCFPPPPYHKPQEITEWTWKMFLEKAGMVCEVTESLFMRFVSEVADAGKSSLSERVKQQSLELARCLKTSETLREERVLLKLKDVKFLVPLQKNELEYGNFLHCIYPTFPSPTPLVSFSEGCSPRQQFLVWTSSCLLHADADPITFDSWDAKLHDHLGFKPVPPKAIVVRHITNVCQSLSTKGKGETSLLTGFDPKEVDVVTNVMKTIYEHLMTYSEDDLKDLRKQNIIFCMKRKAMFSPDQVVIKILENQTVDGLVVDASEKFGNYFELFERLGVFMQVTANHYCKALERIYESSKGSTLHPNELKRVADAVRNLFVLLKSGSEAEKKISSQTLYLPAEHISWEQISNTRPTKVKLVDSRRLIVTVQPFQILRVKNPIKHLSAFVGFAKLGIKNHDIQQEAALLPEQYKMKQWNDVVTETLLESCRTLSEEDSATKRITELVHSEAIVYTAQRLVNHHRLKDGQEFNAKDAGMIRDRLYQITVVKVKGLKTMLTTDGSELSGTTQKVAFFIDQETLGDERVAKTTLYVDSKQAISVDHRNRSLLRHVRMAVSKNLPFGDFMFCSELEDCLQNPSSATQILDMANISPFDRSWQGTVFPLPGCYVPIDMHDLLDNDVYEFKITEYVAYELHDPLLESDDSAFESGPELSDSEDEIFVRRTQNIQSQKQSEKQPTFIYAKVLSVIEPENTAESSDVSSRLLKMQYVIDTGADEVKQVKTSIFICLVLQLSLKNVLKTLLRFFMQDCDCFVLR